MTKIAIHLNSNEIINQKVSNYLEFVLGMFRRHVGNDISSHNTKKKVNSIQFTRIRLKLKQSNPRHCVKYITQTDIPTGSQSLSSCTILDTFLAGYARHWH